MALNKSTPNNSLSGSVESLALPPDKKSLIFKLLPLDETQTSEVNDFVDFVSMRSNKTQSPLKEDIVESDTLKFSSLSHDLFAQVWDNDEDAEYDKF